MGFLLFLHCAVAILLMSAILMQSGKGGGLTEQFASAESIFGARTNVFMVKATAVLAGLFLITGITLAIFSSRENESLMSARAAAKKLPISASSLPVGTASTAPGTSPSEAQAVGNIPSSEAPKPVDTGDAQPQ